MTTYALPIDFSHPVPCHNSYIYDQAIREFPSHYHNAHLYMGHHHITDNDLAIRFRDRESAQRQSTLYHINGQYRKDMTLEQAVYDQVPSIDIIRHDMGSSQRQELSQTIATLFDNGYTVQQAQFSWGCELYRSQDQNQRKGNNSPNLYLYGCVCFNDILHEGHIWGYVRDLSRVKQRSIEQWCERIPAIQQLTCHP